MGYHKKFIFIYQKYFVALSAFFIPKTATGRLPADSGNELHRNPGNKKYESILYINYNSIFKLKRTRYHFPTVVPHAT